MKIFTVLSFFALAFASTAQAEWKWKALDKDAFFAVRSIDGNGAYVDGRYWSIHEFSAQAEQQACSAALEKCQQVTGQSCVVTYQKDTLGVTGTLWAPADFLCVTKTAFNAELEQETAAKNSVWNRVIAHWSELKTNLARYFDPLSYAEAKGPGVADR